MHTRKSTSNHNGHGRVPLAVVLGLLSVSLTALAQTPTPEEKAKNQEFVQRISKGWQMAEAAAKKLKYRVNGFSFSGGAGIVPWRGKTSSGDGIEGRFSIMPMEDGTTFSRHYVDKDASLKARTALLDDWTKAGVLDTATAESTGKAWEELSTKAKSLRYTVSGYGVASGKDRRESAVMWRAGGSGKQASGVFSVSLEKSVAQREAMIDAEVDKEQRDALLKSWAEAGIVSADEAAAVAKAWDEAAVRIAKEGYTGTSYRLAAPLGSVPSAKVEWRGKDASGKSITGSY